MRDERWRFKQRWDSIHPTKSQSFVPPLHQLTLVELCLVPILLTRISRSGKSRTPSWRSRICSGTDVFNRVLVTCQTIKLVSPLPFISITFAKVRLLFWPLTMIMIMDLPVEWGMDSVSWFVESVRWLLVLERLSGPNFNSQNKIESFLEHAVDALSHSIFCISSTDPQSKFAKMKLSIIASLVATTAAFTTAPQKSSVSYT